jgi:tryptophan 2,3-dioxygenase
MSTLSPILSQILQPFPLTDYLSTCSETGRKDVEPALREDLHRTFKVLDAIIDTGPNLSKLDWNVLNLAHDFLWAESELAQNPTPRYPIYTNLRVLDRYIGVRSYLPVSKLWTRCRHALTIITRDWLEFERQALDLNNAKKPTRTGFSPTRVAERIKKLATILDNLENGHTPVVPKLGAVPVAPYPVDWGYYANELDGLAAVAHATALPQSLWHDEYLFLRTIHLNEVCFWAIINGIRAATNAFRLRNYGATSEALKQATFFANLLESIFDVFKTMPYESFFDGFRIATGQSSAIQSEKYQHLEIISRGLNHNKRRAVGSHPELSWLRNWLPPEDCTLQGLVAEVANSAEGELAGIEQDAFRLDRALLTWRNLHLGIARHYLPREAQGTGNEGIPYLENIIRDPIPPFRKTDNKLPQGAEAQEEMRWFMCSPHANQAVPKMRMIGIKLERVLVAAVRGRIDSKKGDFVQAIQTSSPARERSFDIYEKEFAKHGKSFPLKGQLSSTRKKGLPEDPIRALLLGLELSTGVLMGIHDLTRITEPVQFQLAADGQKYLHIDRKQRTLKADEWLFSDAKGTFASYFQGPDSRTQVAWGDENRVPAEADLLFLILGAPNLPDQVLNNALQAVTEFFSPVAGSIKTLELMVGQ